MLTRRATLAAAVAALVLGVVVPVIARAAPPPNGGSVTQQCDADLAKVPQAGPRGCRTAQSVTWGTAAECRTPLYDTPDPSASERCAVVDGRPVSEARITAYRGSWVHRALSLQRGLDAAA